MLSKEQIPNSIRLPDSGRLLLAFSGGSDSLFLMAVLSILAPNRSEAVYIDHGIRDRAELDNEIALNIKNAKLLGIKLTIIKLPEGGVAKYSIEKKCGIEAAARSYRYNALEKFASDNGFDYILTAHHREDQVETILMRLLQNAPFYTLQGILYKDGKIVRPLLSVSKSTIDALIRESGLVFSEDSTNKDIKYRRNRIRHILMPHITEKERCLISNISNNIYLYREKYRKSHKEIELKYSDFVSIDLDAFSSADNLSKEEAIFRASNYLGNPERLSRGFLNEIYSSIEAGRGRLNTAYLDFIVSKKELRIFKRVGFFSEIYSSALTRIGPFSILHTAVDSKTLLIDSSLFIGKVIIRRSKADDVIKLKEGSKKVSELEKRAFAPFSVVLEDENGIIAVFLRQFGANDRLCLRFLTGKGTPIRLV